MQTSGTTAGGLVSGMSKPDYFDYYIRSIMVEGDQIDLLAMGRPEGQGCYCPANQAMRLVIDRLSGRYPFVVLDNEAGLEHLSRRTTRNVDHLLIVSDPGQRGLIAARRVAELAAELQIEVKQTQLILNRLPNGQIPPALQPFIASTGAPLLGVIPADDGLLEFELTGRPLLELADESPVAQAMAALMGRLVG